MTATALECTTLRGLIRAAVTRRENPQREVWAAAFAEILAHPLPEDEALLEIGRVADLSSFELLALALAAAVESDVSLGEQVARLQAPLGRARPLVGFLGVVLADVLGDAPRLLELAGGRAVSLGLFEIGPPNVALPERTVSVPLHVCAALSGLDVFPAQVRTLSSSLPLPDSTARQAHKYAAALRSGKIPALVLRGSGSEPEAIAARIAMSMGRRPVFLEKAEVAALGPWLMARKLMPVHVVDLGPGEVLDVRAIGGYSGPQLVSATPQGAIAMNGAPLIEWRVPLPEAGERRTLWQAALPDAPEFGAAIAPLRRYSASRIHHLGSLMRQISEVEGTAADEDALYRASWIVERQALGHMATAVEEAGKLELLVAPKVAEILGHFLVRCRKRDQLSGGLGPSARARYRPGVRALFTGPPGTGKSLGAGWIASQLKLPLFRVDLATVVSKYIGETEKNLARLFDQAEQSEVVLLFDEADALFSKRTGVQDAHDRFANTQTNYLLQRMESFGGIAILTTNHDANLDPAFQRRLDFVAEFANPGPAERRDLWLSHLGGAHGLEPAQLNRLSALLDWSGGHIRNAVLHAASASAGTIGWADVMTGVRLEARKLRSSLPLDLLDSA